MVHYNHKSYVALEKINNGTICVIEKGINSSGVRNMTERNDINKTLVYVSNSSQKGRNKNEPIEKGTWCRCLEGMFVPKLWIE